MNPLITFFAAGTVFWIGLAVLVTGILMAQWHRHWWQRIGGRVLPVIGWLGIASSSTPLPNWLSFLLFIATAALLLILHLPGEARSEHLIRIFGAINIMACLTAAVLELPHWLLPRIPPGKHSQVAVIGDSITAGIGFPGEQTWTEVFSEKTGVPLIAYAVGGGTCESALADAKRLSPEISLLILEIGGNDILGRTTLPKFTNDLENLLLQVAVPDRTVLMFELPTPPLYAGFIRSQRQLAKKYRIVLLPRRIFAGFLSGNDATVDGLHLSNEGHRRMADRITEILHDKLGTGIAD